MKKLLFFCAILFILISPVFGLRYLILKNRLSQQLIEPQQLVKAKSILNVKSWLAINSYAAAFSVIIGFLLLIGLIWVEKTTLPKSSPNSRII